MNAFARLWMLACLVAACAGQAPAAEDSADPEAMQAADAESTDRVDLAMSAAPPAVSRDAAIMDFDAEGNLVELRAGTNGWLCLPDDNPLAPGDAPICVDGAWQQWLDAYMKQEAPAISGVGISYMLMGGPAPSNTDPYAEAPAPGEDWIQDGPHMMVVVPDPAMLDAFPTDHTNGGPYVMWKGTPYAHLMVPVDSN